MGYTRITERQKATYLRNRFDHGLSINNSAKKAKISRSTGIRLERLHGQDSKTSRALDKASERFAGPVPTDQLSDRARRGLEDFEFFRRTYLGHISTPWQVDTAHLIARLLDTPDKEFVCENCPPGAGKSTLAVDVATWLIARNRRVRILFGSRVQSNADRSLKRVRRGLERTTPFRAPDEEKALGVSVDAQATLAEDYGLFRPVAADTWRGDEFIVAQFDDELIEEKEPTCSSYGMDSGVLGNRFNFMFWDDVVDKTTIRTMEATEAQRQWWDDEAETRLEPGGVLFLIGQRMAANDLYRYNLDKKIPLSEEDSETAMDLPEYERIELENGQKSKYTHVLYLAHYDDRCQGRDTHRRDAPAYPDGCLLDPYRMPWKELYDIMHTKPATWPVQYQQEDTSKLHTLVNPVWVSGGTDPVEGTLHPGCLDETRKLTQLPEGLKGPKFSICAVDPSPTKMWAIQWWIYTPEASNRLWLMDLLRQRMGGNELLDWNMNTASHYGVMEDWQERSVRLGYPITHWIVEVNAAQKFLLQYQFVANWQSKWHANIIPHSTNRNKIDADLGLDMVKDWWRFGRIRLPYFQGDHRLASMKLTDECVKHPKGWTDDQVMAHWFVIHHLPRIAVKTDPNLRLDRPQVAKTIPDMRLAAV